LTIELGDESERQHDQRTRRTGRRDRKRRSDTVRPLYGPDAAEFTRRQLFTATGLGMVASALQTPVARAWDALSGAPTSDSAAASILRKHDGNIPEALRAALRIGDVEASWSLARTYMEQGLDPPAGYSFDLTDLLREPDFPNPHSPVPSSPLHLWALSAVTSTDQRFDVFRAAELLGSYPNRPKLALLGGQIASLAAKRLGDSPTVSDDRGRALDLSVSLLARARIPEIEQAHEELAYASSAAYRHAVTNANVHSDHDVVSAVSAYAEVALGEMKAMAATSRGFGDSRIAEIASDLAFATPPTAVRTRTRLQQIAISAWDAYVGDYVSSHDDWAVSTASAAKGRLFYQAQDFRAAAECFEKADLPGDADIAQMHIDALLNLAFTSTGIDSDLTNRASEVRRAAEERGVAFDRRFVPSESRIAEYARQPSSTAKPWHDFYAGKTGSLDDSFFD
jgi:hypothetical protein